MPRFSRSPPDDEADQDIDVMSVLLTFVGALVPWSVLFLVIIWWLVQ